MFDVTAIGELLIDFTQTRNPEDETVSFVQNPGVAPANVLAALAKFNRKPAFIGKVGNDSFGHFLEQVLIDCGIHTSYHVKEMMKKGLLNSDIVKLSEEFGIKVFKSTKKETMIGYNVEKEEMYISKKLG